MSSRLRPDLPWIALLVLALPAGAARGDMMTLMASQDNTLYEVTDDGPDDQRTGTFLSNGAGQFFFAGRTNQMADSIRRGLVAFDVAGALPAGAVVQSVQLELDMSMSGAGDQPVALHRVLADWGEGTSDAVGGEGGGAPATTDDATWAHTFFDTAFWASQGGDFAAAPSAAQTVGGPGTYAWGSTPEMVADVQDWLDNPAGNFGWLLLGDESTQPTSKRFNSLQNGDPSTGPRLTIEFASPVPAWPPWMLAVALSVLLALGLWRLRRVRLA